MNLLLQVCYEAASHYYARKSPAEQSWPWPQPGNSPQTFSSLAGSEKEEAAAVVTGEETAGWEDLILSTLEPAQTELSQDLAQFISDHSHSHSQHPDQQLFFLPEQENSFVISF